LIRCTVRCSKDAAADAADFNTNFVAKLHNDLKIDNERFTMRYQNFVLRFMEPVDLFKKFSGRLSLPIATADGWC
jgi:adenosine deaminase/adenosine deaminase CECR1